MATVMADNNRVAWTYTDDKAVDYRVSAKEVYVGDGTDGAKYGGEAAAASVPHLPKGFIMRKAKCSCSGKPDLWVVVYETDAAAWTTGGTTLVRCVNGVDNTYTVSAGGRRSEKRPRDGITDAA